MVWGLAPDSHAPHPILCTDKVLTPWLPGSLPTIQYERMHTVLKRVSDDPNGRTLLHAYATWATLRDKRPDIIWREGQRHANATTTPAGAGGGIGWQVDLDFLAQATLAQALKELADRYKDITQVQFQDPYACLGMNHTLHTIDPQQERSWNDWLTAGPDGEPRQARQRAIERMRACLIEMRCYGGLDHARFLDLLLTLSKARERTPCMHMCLDLAYLELDSIPPIPPQVDAVNLSGNVLDNWNNLPGWLRSLDLRGHRGSWPRDVALPAELVELDLSGSDLTTAPPAFLDRLRPLRHLSMLSLRDTNIRVLPGMTNTVRSLDIRDNHFRAIPANLPSGLEFLHASGNPLQALPADMHGLPADLRCMYLQSASTQGLEVPEGLRRNTRLYIDLVPTTGAGITPLETTLRDLLGVFLNCADGCFPADARRYQEAAARWDTLCRELVDDPDRGVEVFAFRAFLKGLAQAPAYLKHEKFRQGVQAWIIDLANRRGLLDTTLGACLEATESCGDRVVFAFNRLMIHRLNCDIEDGLLDGDIARVIDIARQVYSMGVLDDVAARLLYEIRRDSIEAVVHRAGRPGSLNADIIGAPEVLNEIRELEHRIDTRTHHDFVLDELELRLALLCLVSDPDALDLWALAPERASVVSSQIDGQRVRPLAVAEVRRRGALEFPAFLAADYAPWSSLLKRRAADEYARAEADLHESVAATTFDAEVDAAAQAVTQGLDDSNVRDDARKDAGVMVTRRLRLQALLPVTLRFLNEVAVNGGPIELPFGCRLSAEPASEPDTTPDGLAPAQAGWQRA
ncbi:hypothetical protein ASB57_02785 [Bordetella sp. N]|nr:hypothetical protein ASB57_02785 [Bordetella sp. N]